MQIPLPDGSYLMHYEAPYDAGKAHDYYVRNRKLKGRGAHAIPQMGKKTAGGGSSTGKKSHADKAVKPQFHDFHKENSARVMHKIGLLRGVLKELLDQKHKNEHPDKKKEATKSTSDTKPADRKALTAKQKDDAKKRSKDYYDKHKDPKDMSPEELDARIKHVRERITSMKEMLRAGNKLYSQTHAGPVGAGTKSTK